MKSDKSRTSHGADLRIIPAAVFTAHLGSNWTRLPDFVSEVEARNSKKLVSCLLREYNIELQLGDLAQGILYEGKYAVAFSWQNVERWDQAGRDADYYACAFVPQGLLGEIDFDALLRHTHFTHPAQNPTDRIDCSDMRCGAVACERWQKARGAICEDRCTELDWTALGPMLSQPEAGASRWLVVSVKTAKGVSCYSRCQPRNEVHVFQSDKAKGLKDDASLEMHPADLQREYEKLRDEYKHLEAECAQLRVECGQVQAEYDQLRVDNDIRSAKLANAEESLLKLQVSNQKLEQRRSASENDMLFKITIVGLLAFVMGLFMKMGIGWLCG